jgi:hypothetical protein
MLSHLEIASGEDIDARQHFAAMQLWARAD